MRIDGEMWMMREMRIVPEMRIVREMQFDREMRIILPIAQEMRIA